jgi:polyhydroxyalkanoate synthesis regulator phasin
MEAQKEKRSLGEHFERLWGQALTAVSTAEDEALKVVQRMSEAAGGWSPEEMKQRARELTERLVSQRRELERTVDDAVRGTLVRLKVPKREQIQEVQARLETLATRIDRLSAKGKGEGRPARER